jgi:hypothetical protein
VLAAGCGGETEREPAPEPAPAKAAPARKPDPRLTPARCPDGVGSCRSATGTILYVERIDPDGDGDAHFVLLDPRGITAPGITVVDVAPALRPEPLPGPGDALSAAGPVYPGSYGQRQLEADVVHVAR